MNIFQTNQRFFKEDRINILFIQRSKVKVNIKFYQVISKLALSTNEFLKNENGWFIQNYSWKLYNFIKIYSMSIKNQIINKIILQIIF